MPYDGAEVSHGVKQYPSGCPHKHSLQPSEMPRSCTYLSIKRGGEQDDTFRPPPAGVLPALYQPQQLALTKLLGPRESSSPVGQLMESLQAEKEKYVGSVEYKLLQKSSALASACLQYLSFD